MVKSLFRMFICSLIATTAHASTLVEVKAGYFFFANSTMRQVYGGGLDTQLCASYPFWCLNGWTLDAYGAVGYANLSGKSINDNQNTSVWWVPVSVGLKPVYAINSHLDYYFAIGPRYLYMHQHNDSAFVIKNSSADNVGFFINTGLNYKLFNRLVVDIFGEYSYVKIDVGGAPLVYTRDMQVGGLTFGAGIGYEF